MGSSSSSVGTYYVPTLPDYELRPEVYEAYYIAYKALSTGSSSRQALPPELVLHICRLAEFERYYIKRTPRDRKEVHASDSQAQSLVWLQTGPFTKQMGQVDEQEAVSWSWFELQVARPVEEPIGHAVVKRRPDGSEMSWRCLSYPVGRDGFRSQGYFKEHEGDEFNPDHEIWNQIEEGDVLQVVMKAQFGGWSNAAYEGLLFIGAWWEPSAKMLDLMEKSNIQSK
ncbi:hypothetical protein OPQ81_004922 [Rhizoctonia solani]|nr:hypothetical protein OPQ81_004922 [Rhizoctonia solani]